MAKAIWVRAGSIRQLANKTPGVGAKAKRPNAKIMQTMRTHWKVFSQAVMRLLTIFVGVNNRGGGLILLAGLHLLVTVRRHHSRGAARGAADLRFALRSSAPTR